MTDRDAALLERFSGLSSEEIDVIGYASMTLIRGHNPGIEFLPSPLSYMVGSEHCDICEKAYFIMSNCSYVLSERKYDHDGGIVHRTIDDLMARRRNDDS